MWFCSHIIAWIKEVDFERNQQRWVQTCRKCGHRVKVMPWSIYHLASE